MTPSGFTAVGQSQPGFAPTSPAKAGFDIIQVALSFICMPLTHDFKDHLNAQLSSEASEPAPKFDIKPSKVMF